MSQNRIAKGPESYIPPVICKCITMCYINDIIHDHSKLPQMQNKGRVVTPQPHGLCSKKKEWIFEIAFSVDIISIGSSPSIPWVIVKLRQWVEDDLWPKTITLQPLLMLSQDSLGKSKNAIWSILTDLI